MRSINWLSLIQPINNMIFGTRHDDVLSALANGDIVYGLRGDDLLSSNFNRTALIGGAGNDTLLTDITAGVRNSGTTNGVAVQDGGTGDDTMQVNLNLTGFDVTSDIVACGGSGDDQIDVVAIADRFSPGNSFLTNTVDGGGGDDHITAYGITPFVGLLGTVQNILTGGRGNDVMEATAIAQTNNPQLASNSLDGGAGNDVLRAICSTDSNVRAPVGINELSGGDGHDVLEAIQITDGENSTTDVTNNLNGGNGNDILTADSTALAQFQVFATNFLQGGNGNDVLTARLTAGVSAAVPGLLEFNVSNVVTGGNGNDHLEAYAEAMFGSVFVEELPRIENHLEGGNGVDVLLATIAEGTAGSSFLDGGAGDDQLMVIGGSGNTLIGGDGRDWLVGGVGDEQLTGGRDADTFHFDVSVNQGTDTILDFENRRDILSFSGLIDQGPPGLVDDLDAITTITDFGAGNDVVVEFDSGTHIVFSGLGTGNIDTWSEMVLHPATQLVASGSSFALV